MSKLAPYIAVAMTQGAHRGDGTKRNIPIGRGKQKKRRSKIAKMSRKKNR